jgi:hypothetical protein
MARFAASLTVKPANDRAPPAPKRASISARRALNSKLMRNAASSLALTAAIFASAASSVGPKRLIAAKDQAAARISLALSGFGDASAIAIISSKRSRHCSIGGSDGRTSAVTAAEAYHNWPAP